MKGRKKVIRRWNGASTNMEQDACPVGQPDGSMTEENQERLKFTLKNGDQVDARRTVILYERLSAMMEVQPLKFESLLALARDKLYDAARDHIEEFKERGLVDSTGAIVPDVRSVLLSSYQLAPDGPVLTHPVRLDSIEDRAKVERVNQQLGRRIRDFLADRGDENRSPN